MTTTTTNIWSQLPLIAKGVIILGGGFLAYRVVKNLIEKTKLDPTTRDSSQEQEGWNQSFIIDANVAKPSLTNTQLKSFANTIFRAMDGYGTDEDAIVAVFKNIKNNADFSGLNTAWGKREISSGRFNPSPNLKNATLAEAMTDELSRYWLDLINKDLSKKNIKYQF